jgi:acyl-CoA thioester hydrolase
MAEFRFYHTMEVRWADIDSRRHVNNARYFTYMEQARVRYFEHLGLWDGKDVGQWGSVLAEARCTFLEPVFYGQQIRIGVRTSRLGDKSMEMAYSLQDVASGREVARGISIQVSYDYDQGQTMRVPDNWRQAIGAFEGLDDLESGRP